jgi:enoyl-CoA hydratase/carnithine racemase
MKSSEPAEAPTASVLIDRDGPLATLTLNRPAKLNAIDRAMLERLDSLLAALDRDTAVRVVVLTGAGDRAFSAGADVNQWSDLEPLEMWRSWVREGHHVFDRLARLRQPTIAAINGVAFGGGLELALATDLRLLASEAAVALPEVTIGTLPGWAGTRRLPALIGPTRAKQLIFSGARLDAATAERWGLVNEVVERARLLSRAHELAAQIAANAPLAVQLAKQAIDGDAAALEAMAGALAAGSADGREGIAAFREKRPARFAGN